MYKKLILIIILILSFEIVSCSIQKSFKMTTNINSSDDLVDLLNYASKSGNLEAIKYVVEKYKIKEDLYKLLLAAPRLKPILKKFARYYL